ncbi:RidA family protein [Cohnella sp. REN36]|uniref:RidA family protein n=1 Tax=Cohnella sp. REN36 TaxID=2887347 RepID=UPI001D15DC0E|nr:RidA family protein [Cohnella sp. REN36]MCC3371543.1 RidA family protein [Cohnella sp. REN36]
MVHDNLIHYNSPATMPPANGYSHVVEARQGRTIYISGQVALNAAGELVGPGDLAAQTRQVFENIRAALEAARADFHDVVKLTFFLTDIAQIRTVREIRDEYVQTAKPPASSAVEASRLVDERFLIEIEAIAVGV